MDGGSEWWMVVFIVGLRSYWCMVVVDLDIGGWWQLIVVGDHIVDSITI